MPSRILVVDDEKAIRTSLEQGLSAPEREVMTAGSGREALQLLRKTKPDLALLDIKLPDADGVDLLRRFRRHRPDLPVIMVTAYGDTELVVSAMKAGAENYLTKPFDLEQLRRLVNGLVENRQLKSQVENLKAEQRRRLEEEKIFQSRNDKMKDVVSMADKISDGGNTPVLLQGETGTGKRLLAGRIHLASPRKGKPFLEFNCAAVQGPGAEAELFGSESGPDSSRRVKQGLLEMADGGSLFLDEVSELAASAQVKLLRYLESRSYKRVGGTQDCFPDVRILAATNEDLGDAVREKHFRQDLYFRLKVIPLFIPPLRERREDLLPLANHFLAGYATQFRKDAKKFSGEAAEKLVGYHWPGNVRELKNVVERAVLLSGGESLGCEHLPNEVMLATSMLNTPGLTPQAPLEDVEKKYILEVFTANRQNLSRTARLLQISRSTLREKLQRYGVARGRKWR